MAKPTEKREPTFEQALAELDKIVSAIDEGKVGLEESIAQYEKGMKLIQYCRSILDRSETKVQQLQLDPDGEPRVAPFSPPEVDSSEQG